MAASIVGALNANVVRREVFFVQVSSIRNMLSRMNLSKYIAYYKTDVRSNHSGLWDVPARQSVKRSASRQSAICCIWLSRTAAKHNVSKAIPSNRPWKPIVL
jgi:hypothetical protein